MDDQDRSGSPVSFHSRILENTDVILDICRDTRALVDDTSRVLHGFKRLRRTYNDTCTEDNRNQVAKVIE